jgi:hypothetical protein
VSIQKTLLLDFVSSGIPSILCLLVHIVLHGTAVAFDGAKELDSGQQMNEPSCAGGEVFPPFAQSRTRPALYVLDCGYERSGAPIMSLPRAVSEFHVE